MIDEPKPKREMIFDDLPSEWQEHYDALGYDIEQLPDRYNKETGILERPIRVWK